MLAHEIIQLSRIPQENFNSLTQQALNHALWHYVQYFDDEDDLVESLSCLIKESLSKLLFRFFCLQNKLPIEFEQQNGDRYLSFKLNEQNWELINLSINAAPIKLSQETTSLPAMIPLQKLDCSQKDDFGNTLTTWATSINKQALFTFLHNNSEDCCFIKLELPIGLKNLYLDFFNRKKRGKNLKESDFWKKLKALGVPTFLINHNPDFYITAWAGSEHWKFFYASNAASFPNIQSISSENKAILIHRLPAFSRLFPQFNETLHFAEFLN